MQSMQNTMRVARLRRGFPIAVITLSQHGIRHCDGNEMICFAKRFAQWFRRALTGSSQGLLRSICQNSVLYRFHRIYQAAPTEIVFLKRKLFFPPRTGAI
jgi:hypothetical protein